jgi:hypothetical protein
LAIRARNLNDGSACAAAGVSAAIDGDSESGVSASPSQTSFVRAE